MCELCIKCGKAINPMEKHWQMEQGYEKNIDDDIDFIPTGETLYMCDDCVKSI